MLRGRCSCAISGLPTASRAFQSPLTPLFPLHPRNSPVSPFFPLLTQKQGGGGHPNEAKEAKEVKDPENNRAFLTPAFTTTSIAIVGAPTFWSPATPLSFFRVLLNLKLTTENLELPKSNHSRTSEVFARKSNYSRTYAKTRGWGCLPQKVFSCNSFVFCGRVNYSVKYNCRGADIPVSARHPQINWWALAGAERHDFGRCGAWQPQRIPVPWQWRGCAQSSRRRRGP